MSEPQKKQNFTFAETLEQTLSRLTENQRTAFAVGGTLASLVGIVPGCDPAAPVETDAASRTQEVLADGQRDWAQNMGLRDRSMVRYYHEFWRECSGGSRFGCSAMTVVLKVAVRPMPGGDLAYKKVGVVYREIGKGTPITATGTYFSLHADGMEEWHIPIRSTSYQGVFTFNAWYEDGKYGRYYDDNNGELYAVSWTDSSSDLITIRPDWAASTAKIDASGMSGRVAVIVEDLDYDKDLSIEWTTDNWATKNTFGMGGSGDKNKLFWDSNLGRDFDRWVVDVDLPGSFTAFRYRVLYRHGVVGGADVQTFVGGGPNGFLIERRP